ncbi:hypothetical protein C8J55DRAFT_43143 [Lentinula edodes]|uniref:Uncharacterized protein n=1 Tax=Lentinula lateritia TaxID=40482 RepID=A0A9W9DR88_9AGAR|nr:hypothetical protein C8J55DRAFT_43143 [Lentinula edodes]
MDSCSCNVRSTRSDRLWFSKTSVSSLPIPLRAVQSNMHRKFYRYATNLYLDLIDVDYSYVVYQRQNLYLLTPSSRGGMVIQIR